MVDEALAMMNISEDLKEKLKRERIGMPNKGRVPWNKGKQHSPRNLIFTDDPKAREKRMAKHPRSHWSCNHEKDYGRRNFLFLKHKNLVLVDTKLLIQ